MPIKMNQCDDCYALCSNSATKCHECGSKKLVKGPYITKEEAQIKIHEENNTYSEHRVIQCSLFCFPVLITNGKGSCLFCDEEVNIKFTF